MYENYKALKVTSEGGVVRIVLDNPPMNGMLSEMHGELSSIFSAVREDSSARVVVLTGAGDRAFSAGGDPNKLAAGPGDHSDWLQTMHEARNIVLSMLDCDVPVIARINGHAIGVGATIALCSDITLMSERGKIGDTHVKIGLSAGDGGSLLWPHLVGMVTAKRYLLSGDLLTGTEAAEIGLVTEACAFEDLDARTQHWVDHFLSLSPVALRMTKRSLNMSLRSQAESFMDAQLGLETFTYISADFKEAGAAMLEKRAPVFTGK